ncbi:hypothetical protein B0T19DRAFT_280299 [Cercophora scortea]|uniref:DUF1917-domain-containing protein n=1 Tax=Cercophora scortea TaxID=314031 RepID=A0AAE0I7L9_9PEZI|nr:hypothetical protein B0T19DRAFT_280299 [Cercophora scortea]
MDSDAESDFYGSEETIAALNFRLNSHTISSLWITHQASRSLLPRPNDALPPPPGALHNHFPNAEDRLSARQLDETVDAFLARLPPATTDIAPGLDWIWIANPYIPPPDPKSRPLVGAFNTRGRALLDSLTAFIAANSRPTDGKSPFVAQRAIAKQREDTVQSLHDLAVECNLLSGKWMLFPQPGDVDAVWARVARATANNELGQMAKVATRTANSAEPRLICVYTKDYRDKEDVARVLRRLRELGLVRDGEKRIYYKTDGWTNLGIYGGNDWNIKASLYSSNDIFAYIKQHGSRR